MIIIVKGRKIGLSVLLKLAYLVLLVSTFFYVKSVLRTDTFTPTEKTPEEKAVEVKKATIRLTVYTSEEIKSYKAKLTNMDTVEDFLSELRDDQGLYYEVDLYTYGAEVASVFGEEAESGNKWAVLLDGKDITNKISDVHLIENSADTFILKQVPVTRSEGQ